MLKIFLYNRKSSKKVPCECKTCYPNKCAGDIIEKKSTVMHFAYPGHKGGKGSNYRNETGKNNCFSTVFFIKIARFLKILLLKKARVLRRKHTGTNKISYPVINGIAKNRCGKKSGVNNKYIKKTASRKRSYNKKERVSGEERGNYQAGFGKYN